jgi:hypothetical protein
MFWEGPIATRGAGPLVAFPTEVKAVGRTPPTAIPPRHPGDPRIHVASLGALVALVQHSCRNAEVVEAFCPVAASRSNTRRSIHQPPVAALHAPAEMPTALSGSPVGRDPRRLVLASRLPSRAAPTCDPHSARCSAGCHTSRDFVPWRFLDAGQLSLRSVSSLPASKNQHRSGHLFLVKAPIPSSFCSLRFAGDMFNCSCCF